MKVCRQLLLVILILPAYFRCFSQSIDAPDRMDELTETIAKVIRQEHIVGLMLGITTRDSVLFTGGFGYADLAAGRKVDAGTLFRMGSITKLFVSTGILQLVNEGKLRLADELKIVAPEIPFHNPWEKKHPLRIIDLLEHTTGFDDVKLNRMYSLDTIELSGWEMVKIQEPSLVCRWPPGERFAYANPNYDILGYLIEKITGIPYDRYLTRHILAPLEMTHSNFSRWSEFPLTNTREYVVKNGQATQVPSVTVLGGPHGALWSNAEEMLTFIRLFLRDGAPLLPAVTIREMELPHSSLAARSGLTSGYGLGNENDFFANFPLPFHGHEGLTGTCHSAFHYNRKLGVGYVLACNSNQDLHRIETLIVTYLERGQPAPQLATQPLDVAALLPFLGRYQFESPRNEIAAFKDKLVDAPLLYLHGRKLYFRPLLGPPSELVQTAPLTFAWARDCIPLIRLTKNDAGKNVLLVAGAYYEQTSNAWSLLKRLLLVLALLLTASSALAGLVAIVRAALRKLRWKRALLLVLPLIGLTGLALAVAVLLDVQTYTYKLAFLRTVNASTLTIFFGTSLFAATSIISLFTSVLLFRKRAHRLQSIYFLLSSFSSCAILVLLCCNGWIGLRTWAL